MRVVVVGSGYVGLVSGTCFAEMGNTVTCMDISEDKINGLKNGIIPIYEPGLKSLVLKNFENQNLHFTTKLSEALNDAEIVFIAVGTPTGEDGSADLQYVLSVAESIGKTMNRDLIIVDKSTVPVGTADLVKNTIQKELTARNAHHQFWMVSNPEFLKEGDAINDFMKPDRVVIGADSDFAFGKMKELYSPFFRTHDRFIEMDIRSAEMTKYAANAMLATKISFMNEIANICERVGADVNQVRIGIGSDSRIGYSFIYPGCGYGGSCFPKDVKALIRIADQHHYSPELISSVEAVNNRQKMVIAQKIIEKFGDDLSGKTFGLWGLAFKPGTDDMREAPAIYTVKELVSRGAKIRAYDPKAMEEAQNHYLKGIQNISYCQDKYDALEKCDAMILLTEWKEFRSPDFDRIKKCLNHAIIFDGRNQYLAQRLHEKEIEYIRIGK
ncbi:MAG: UDP-glucose/GDP-mannose dehydrogenase family protein [Flavobacteriales bacterium]|jgi:UDPglucose 6-dehydrogenase|nr:UDP-glucose/GDP-mannose dehydrogenase family protein [Flavobacteriales bacterium]